MLYPYDTDKTIIKKLLDQDTEYDKFQCNHNHRNITTTPCNDILEYFLDCVNNKTNIESSLIESFLNVISSTFTKHRSRNKSKSKSKNKRYNNRQEDSLYTCIYNNKRPLIQALHVILTYVTTNSNINNIILERKCYRDLLPTLIANKTFTYFNISNILDRVSETNYFDQPTLESETTRDDINYLTLVFNNMRIDNTTLHELPEICRTKNEVIARLLSEFLDKTNLVITNNYLFVVIHNSLENMPYTQKIITSLYAKNIEYKAKILEIFTSKYYCKTKETLNYYFNLNKLSNLTTIFKEILAATNLKTQKSKKTSPILQENLLDILTQKEYKITLEDVLYSVKNKLEIYNLAKYYTNKLPKDYYNICIANKFYPNYSFSDIEVDSHTYNMYILQGLCLTNQENLIIKHINKYKLVPDEICFENACSGRTLVKYSRRAFSWTPNTNVVRILLQYKQNITFDNIIKFTQFAFSKLGNSDLLVDMLNKCNNKEAKDKVKFKEDKVLAGVSDLDLEIELEIEKDLEKHILDNETNLDYDDLNDSDVLSQEEHDKKDKKYDTHKLKRLQKEFKFN
jgi:hypothetical protein